MKMKVTGTIVHEGGPYTFKRVYNKRQLEDWYIAEDKTDVSEYHPETDEERWYYMQKVVRTGRNKWMLLNSIKDLEHASIEEDQVILFIDGQKVPVHEVGYCLEEYHFQS